MGNKNQEEEIAKFKENWKRVKDCSTPCSGETNVDVAAITAKVKEDRVIEATGAVRARLDGQRKEEVLVINAENNAIEDRRTSKVEEKTKEDMLLWDLEWKEL